MCPCTRLRARARPELGGFVVERQTLGDHATRSVGPRAASQQLELGMKAREGEPRLGLRLAPHAAARGNLRRGDLAVLAAIPGERCGLEEIEVEVFGHRGVIVDVTKARRRARRGVFSLIRVWFGAQGSSLRRAAAEAGYPQAREQSQPRGHGNHKHDTDRTCGYP